MRKHGTVHTKFWTNPKTADMSNDARFLFLYLLTGPHTTALGAFRCPDAYVTADLRYDSETVSKLFSELVEAGLVARCKKSGWVLIKNFLEKNGPANANQGIRVANVFADTPQSISIYNDIVESLRNYPQHLPEGFLNGLETVEDRFPQRFRNTDTDTDTDTESDTESEPDTEPDTEPESESDTEPPREVPPDGGTAHDESCEPSPPVPADVESVDVEIVDEEDDDEEPAQPAKSSPCPHQAIVDLYHEILPELASVRSITPQLQKTLRARWRESPERQSLDWWRWFFQFVHDDCGYLMGRVKDWAATFPWLIGPKNMTKVLNGAYDDRGRRKRTGYGMYSEKTMRTIQNLRDLDENDLPEGI